MAPLKSETVRAFLIAMSMLPRYALLVRRKARRRPAGSVTATLIGILGVGVLVRSRCIGSGKRKGKGKRDALDLSRLSGGSGDDLKRLVLVQLEALVRVRA